MSHKVSWLEILKPKTLLVLGEWIHFHEGWEGVCVCVCVGGGLFCFPSEKGLI